MSKKYRLNIPDMVRKCDAQYLMKVEFLDGFEIPFVNFIEHHAFIETTLFGSTRTYNIPKDWLEEIPQKSAFQEWHGEKEVGDFNSAQQIKGRKEGWNAAIDIVLDMIRREDYNILDEEIEELKEP